MAIQLASREAMHKTIKSTVDDSWKRKTAKYSSQYQNSPVDLFLLLSLAEKKLVLSGLHDTPFVEESASFHRYCQPVMLTHAYDVIRYMWVMKQKDADSPINGGVKSKHLIWDLMLANLGFHVFITVVSRYDW